MANSETSGGPVVGGMASSDPTELDSTHRLPHGRSQRGSRRVGLPPGTARHNDEHAAEDPMRVFGRVRPLEARSLAGPVLEVQVPAGTEIVREGQVTGTFFVIRTGSAQLQREDRGLGTLGIGDCFGEIDPVPRDPQRFTVVARSSMRLLTFSAFGIGRLCAAIPGARERLVASLPGEQA